MHSRYPVLALQLSVLRLPTNARPLSGNLSPRCFVAQVVLVVAALISVPIMLLPKPLVLQKRFKARQAQLEEYGRVSPHDEDEEAGGNGALRMAAPAHAYEEEFDFSEVIVHQVRSALPCSMELFVA